MVDLEADMLGRQACWSGGALVGTVIVEAGISGVPSQFLKLEMRLHPKLHPGTAKHLISIYRSIPVKVFVLYVLQATMHLNKWSEMLLTNFPPILQGSELNAPVMKMSNIHDGLYYIHFHSTLSALQSFAIAAALIHRHSPFLRPKLYRKWSKMTKVWYLLW